MITSRTNLSCFLRSTVTKVCVIIFFYLFVSVKVSAQGYMKLCSSGITLETAGSLDEAIAKYTSAITLKPDVWNAYSYRAKVYYRKGKYDEAITDISKAIQLSPKKLYLYHIRANCYLAKDEYAKAIPDYTMALLKTKASDHQLYQTYLYRGESYYFNKQYQEAISDFTKSIELSLKEKITPTYTYTYRAYCYFELNNYAEAIKEFDYLLSVYANNSYALFYQGLCYYKTGETAKAKANALKLIELEPAKEVYFSDEHLLDLYDITMRNKMVNQSLELAKKDIKEYKSNTTSTTVGTIKLAEAFAQLDKAWLYSSRITSEDREINDTILANIVYVYSQLKEKPELPELARKYLVQASSSTENKKYSDAIALYNKAISIAPYYPLAYYNRALVYELLSSYTDAITDMKKYIELYPDASNVRTAQDKIYEWEGNSKNTNSFVFTSADGKNIAQSNTEAGMNSSAIDIENIIGNKIETDNKATQGFFINFGLSTPRGYFGMVPGLPVNTMDSSSWKTPIIEKGKIGAQTGWYLELGAAMDMNQKAKVRFYYNPFALCLSKNNINWSSRPESLFSGTDSSKAYYKIELAQRYGISYAPIPKLVVAFYYRLGMTLPVTNYKINYQSKFDSEYFKLTSENTATFIPFAHTLGFSISYSFFTFSYESYFLKTRYRFTAKYHGPSPLDTEQITTFNGKFPMRTNRIGISIHF